MSENLAIHGFLAEEELAAVLPSRERMARGPVAVIECIQDIPCNPCEQACPFQAITVGQPITALPALDQDKCVGCGQCIAHCPGLAIFVVDCSGAGDTATVQLPYEYYPWPDAGEIVQCLNRKGEPVTDGTVTRVRRVKDYNHTAVVTVEAPKSEVNNIRAIRLARGSKNG